ncbi:cell wall hydrolase [Devosia sp.]|uniref:cell wall hydrolase n=1 Tax=Devosia sp. TaxID=1871048 RepID=UPI003264AE9D
MQPTRLTTAARALAHALALCAAAFVLAITLNPAHAETVQPNAVMPLPVPVELAQLRSQPALGAVMQPLAPGDQPLTAALLTNYIKRQNALHAFNAFDEAEDPQLTSDMLLGYISRSSEGNGALTAIEGLAKAKPVSALNTDVLAEYVSDRFKPTEKRMAIADKERDCLTQAIYHEARGESVEGQWAVANIIVNRALSGRFPSTLCGVIYQNAEKGYHRCQFTFACDGKTDAPSERAAWNRSAGVAAKVYAEFAQGEKIPTLPRSALFYHTTSVNPGWSNTYTQVAQIGSHLFYAPNK